MPGSLYEIDALAWADSQALLLRRLASGEGVNAIVDWPHVIEEVQDVGLSELRSCQSLIEQALVHLLKLHAQRDSPACRHWRDEVRAYLDDGEEPAMPLPERCPYALADLLDGAVDVPALVGKLG